MKCGSLKLSEKLFVSLNKKNLSYKKYVRKVLLRVIPQGINTDTGINAQILEQCLSKISCCKQIDCKRIYVVAYICKMFMESNY